MQKTIIYIRNMIFFVFEYLFKFKLKKCHLSSIVAEQGRPFDTPAKFPV